MSDLPADGAFPVFYPLTGVGYAQSAEQQKLWQDDVARFEARLVKSMQESAARRKPEPPSPQFVLDYIRHNPFLKALK